MEVMDVSPLLNSGFSAGGEESGMELLFGRLGPGIMGTGAWLDPFNAQLLGVLAVKDSQLPPLRENYPQPEAYAPHQQPTAEERLTSQGEPALSAIHTQHSPQEQADARFQLRLSPR